MLEEPESVTQSSKKRKADSLKDTPTAGPSHPSKKQAKTASEPKLTPSNPAAASASTAKQQQAKSKGDKPVAAAAEGATAATKKADKAAAGAATAAAAVGGDGAPMSKSQLKKQRKKALGNEAASAADPPGILRCSKTVTINSHSITNIHNRYNTLASQFKRASQAAAAAVLQVIRLV